MNKRKRSRKTPGPGFKWAHAARALAPPLFVGSVLPGEAMNSYTVRRNEWGELTARRGDGVEFVGPVTL